MAFLAVLASVGVIAAALPIFTETTTFVLQRRRKTPAHGRQRQPETLWPLSAPRLQWRGASRGRMLGCLVPVAFGNSVVRWCRLLPLLR